MVESVACVHGRLIRPCGSLSSPSPSYVAATGLPQPRKDHAKAMVRFARDIMQEMQILTRELELELGPDTGDLSLR